jgi:excisionase family DNA binding protein
MSPFQARRPDRQYGQRGTDQVGSARPMKFYTMQDIARMLDVSLRSVRRYIERGELIVHRFGGAIRISDADLKAFLAIHRQE